MKRIVIKVGTAVLTEQNRLAKERMMALVTLISELKSRYEVILVTSGAVAAGYGILKLDKKIIANRQALASIGQPILAITYKKKFERLGVHIAQVLLTEDDFNSHHRIKHAQDMMEVLIKKDIVPIVNENDATAIAELTFGDNDWLSAKVALYFDAKMLVILSDITGYYDKDPRTHSDAKLRGVVTKIQEDELEAKTEAGTEFATGGITTKLRAANFLLENGLPTFLSSGMDLKDVHSFLLEDEHKGGTLFKVEND